MKPAAQDRSQQKSLTGEQVDETTETTLSVEDVEVVTTRSTGVSVPNRSSDSELSTNNESVSNRQLCDSTPPVDAPVVTLFGNIKGDNKLDYQADYVTGLIATDFFRQEIESLREIYAATFRQYKSTKLAKDSVRSAKSELPGVMWSGTFTGRGDDKLNVYSGLICADLDEIKPEQLPELRQRLRVDNHVCAVFLSPTGTGLKVVFRVAGQAREHADNFLGVQKYLKDNYKVDVDTACRNIERMCFLSYDPDTQWNYNSVPIVPAYIVNTKLTPNAKDEHLTGFESETIKDRSTRTSKPGISKQIREALAHVPGDDRQTWLRILGALKGWGKKTNQLELAYEIADEWAARSEKYDDNEQQRVWESLNRNDDEKVATIATLFHLAKNNGWQGSPDSEFIILPSGSVTFTDSARSIFTIASGLYTRGGEIFRLVQNEHTSMLELVTPDAFRSIVEKLGPKLMAWRPGRSHSEVLAPARMSADCAKAIMNTVEARDLLPPIACVVGCTVITRNGEVLGPGYHQHNGGILIQGGHSAPTIEFGKAKSFLDKVIQDFDFVTPGDRSRAMAELITPALRMGGILTGFCPIHVMEADLPRAGKGYLHECMTAIYRDTPQIVAQRSGGVGSTDESFQSALIAGHPFISLDNLRGRIDSTYLEAFVTAPGQIGARIPHRGEIMVDPRRFILLMTSNGVQATVDLSKRSSICRIRKRSVGCEYFPMLEEIKRFQSFYLGCVHAVVRAWIEKGMPRTTESRHDFRVWAQSLDWIVQDLLGCAPLMDGHESAQERVSNPAMSFFRACAVAAEAEGKMEIPMTATQLVELAQAYNVPIPGAEDSIDEKGSARVIGGLGRRLFGEEESVTLDNFKVERGQKRYRKASGNWDNTPSYSFERL